MSRNSRMVGAFMPTIITDEQGTRKRCSFCGKFKSIDNFHKNGVDTHGNIKYRDDCKACYNIRRKENRLKKKHTDFIGSQKRRGEESPELTHQEWKECVIYFGGECAYCGATPRKGQSLTRDHLEPLSKGGRTIQSNIVPACHSCNSSKCASDFKEWFMKQSFFSQERLNRIFKWRTMIKLIEGGDSNETC